MLKFIGCIMIFISCYWFGSIKAFGYKERCKELENIIEIIKFIELEITYKKEPLSKAFKKACRIKECWFTSVLKESGSMLENNESLSTSWQQSLSIQENDCTIKSEDLTIMEDMIIGLGKSSSEDQRKILEHVSLRLSSNLQKARSQEEKMGRMYKALGTAVGIVLIVIIF